ncbi:MAG: hypothetical protein K2Q18_13765 [Bdellovibrionales bacterium]|nr:hypothetical protein [Bdellovibrionales bacterium]
MSKIFKFLPFILTLFILVSCGADLKKAKALQKEEAALTGPECACNTAYSPVCGSNSVDYDNSCIAACFKATVAKQGHCSCNNSRKVCGDDGNTWGECEAQDMLAAGTLTRIVKFADCSATTY